MTKGLHLSFYLNGALALGAALAFMFKNYPLALLLSLLDINFAIMVAVHEIRGKA